MMTSAIGKKLLRIKDNSGYTLIEVMLVVTIFSILVTISAPLFRNTYESIKMESFVSDLISTCQFAQQSAVIKQSDIQLVFIESQGQFHIEIWAKESPGNQNDQKNKLITGKNLIIPQGINLTSDEETIVFFSDGTATVSEILVNNKINKSLKLKIDRYGNVTLEKIQE